MSNWGSWIKAVLVVAVLYVFARLLAPRGEAGDILGMTALAWCIRREALEKGDQ